MSEIQDGLGQEYGYLAGWFIETDEIDIYPSFPEDEKPMVHKFIEVARKVIPAVAEFPESLKENRKGAVVIISNPEKGVLPVAIAINEDDKTDSEFGKKSNKHLAYALSKAMFAMQNKGAYGSRNNTEKWLKQGEGMMYVKESPIPAGSFSYRGWVVAVSGFNPPEIDEAAAMAIHVGAGNLTPKVAKQMADDMGNNDYLQRTDAYLEPTYH
mgnify:CR=1 FL=1